MVYIYNFSTRLVRQKDYKFQASLWYIMIPNSKRRSR